MARNQQSSTELTQLSEEQEHEILQYVLNETFIGPAVRRELIHWYAERLLQRDGNGHTVGAAFADDFLARHPDMARKLVDPSPPKPAVAEHGDRIQPADRLQAMRQRDRVRALFGDSPPAPRQPAPFPDGDIIYQCQERYIVRHGATVTKLTTFSHGLGSTDHPNEASVLRFVKAHTTIPVPEIISSDWDRLTMQYIEGQTLRQAWPVLTPEERANILTELRGYIAQMRALRGIFIGRLDGQEAMLPGMLTRSGGPFAALADFHDWMVNPPGPPRAQSMYWHQITSQLGADYPIVFTHGDLAARNILVRNGRIAAIVDWELAGWYPEYWEYVFALRGLDNVDWETLGRHLPGLFSKRYDLEYILMGFVTRLF